MDRKQLKNLLSRTGIRPDVYSLEGTPFDNTVVLDYVYGKWIVFYTERGIRSYERSFDSEDEACQYLYDLLKDEA